MEESQMNKPNEARLFYTDAETINGEKIIRRQQSSEHTNVNGKYYGYVCFETESNTYFIPVDLFGYLEMSTEIWNFIDKLPDIK